MRKTFLIVMILLAVLSVGFVSAENNVTDIVTSDDDAVQNPVQAVPDSELEIDASDSNIDAKTDSQISSSKVVSYESFKSDISFKLTSDNKVLADRPVTIHINGNSYNRVTDSKGIATLSVYLKTGKYTATCDYEGDNTTNGVSGTCPITVKAPSKTKLKLGDKDINYRQGSKCLFYVKLVDVKGKAIANQWITFKVDGKTFKAKTDKYGNAQIFLNLKKGKHKVKYYFYKNAPYLASSGYYKINVKAKMAKGDGYWLWPAHMKSLNLKSLSKKGTKHIFLHVEAISHYGKSSVVSFIKKAHKYGIKVHLWMQVAYSGGKWVSLVDNHGKLKYKFMNKKIAEAKRYAKIKGVDGVHFDYMRYGGTAHKHPHAVDSINYFVKKASIQIHKVRPNCIVSLALMPEPESMHYYYGQDVPTLSKYADALLPMVYKGNYHQKSSWIKSVTKTFVRQSNGAQIWTGLQSYYSDSNTAKLPHSVLLKDAKMAKDGGAKGIVLFRIGISCNFNFKKV